MSDRSDADFFEIIGGQVRQHDFVDRMFAERGLILPKIEATQPRSDVHMPAPTCARRYTSNRCRPARGVRAVMEVGIRTLQVPQSRCLLGAGPGSHSSPIDLSGGSFSTHGVGSRSSP